MMLYNVSWCFMFFDLVVKLTDLYRFVLDESIYSIVIFMKCYEDKDLLVTRFWKMTPRCAQVLFTIPMHANACMSRDKHKQPTVYRGS